MRRIASIVLTVATCLPVLGGLASPAEGAGRYVDDTGGVDGANQCSNYAEPCATIQHAIDSAVAWDTIVVRAGTYSENLTVDKRLEFHGPNWVRGLENRDPEAILDGGTGAALTVEAADVKFGGFEIVSEGAGIGVRSSGIAVDNLEINDNLIEGAAAAVALGAGGEGNEIRRNVIRGETGIDLSGSDYSDLAIEYNRFDDPLGTYGVFADVDTSIENLELGSNRFTIPSEIRGFATGEQLVNENEFDLASPTAVALKIRARDARLMWNDFNGHGASRCLQLLGSEPGIGPSEDVHVSGNTFRQCNSYGLQLNPEVDSITVFGNSFPGSSDGVRTGSSSPWNVSEHEIQVAHNRFVGTTQAAIRNSVNGTLDAPNNWWGCNAGPGTPGCDGVSGAVDSSPRIVLTAETRREYEKLEPVNALNPGEKAVIVAHLSYNSAGAYVGWPPSEGLKAGFSASGGTMLPWDSSEWFNGHAIANFTAGSQPGPAGITVSTDNQTIGVPMTILGDLLEAPRPAPLVISPRIAKIGGKVQANGRKLVIGNVYCGSNACTVRSVKGGVRIAGKLFALQIKTPRELAPGAEASIRGVLPKAARRLLDEGKLARVAVTLTAADASGQSVTKTIRARIAPSPAESD